MTSVLEPYTLKAGPATVLRLSGGTGQRYAPAVPDCRGAGRSSRRPRPGREPRSAERRQSPSGKAPRGRPHRLESDDGTARDSQGAGHVALEETEHEIDVENRGVHRRHGPARGSAMSDQQVRSSHDRECGKDGSEGAQGLLQFRQPPLSVFWRQQSRENTNMHIRCSRRYPCSPVSAPPPFHRYALPHWAGPLHGYPAPPASLMVPWRGPVRRGPAAALEFISVQIAPALGDGATRFGLRPPGYAPT
jgi:hypothetical protein